jgi:putative ABC transport system ATP-binding protein
LPTESIAARCEELVRTYRTGSGEVRALKGVTATFARGALTVVVGPSGSGKSSLLRLLAGLDRPTSGSLRVGDTAVDRATSRSLRRMRRTTVGYLFQRPSDNFLPHLSVQEHLRIAERAARTPAAMDRGELLEILGIAQRVDHLPSELSGGEQQRAAIAEVLVSGATIVVADEPTAELDSASAGNVLQTVRTLVEAGITFVIATHDHAVMRGADASIELDHGVQHSSRAPSTVVTEREPVAERPRATRAAETEADAGLVWRAPTTRGPMENPVETPIVLEVDGVSKSYGRGDEVVHALIDVHLTVRAGQIVGLLGRSGSGKTTFLNVVAGWERPDAGTIRRPGDARSVPGWHEIAVVPQKLGLLEELTVRENIEYPARLTGRLPESADLIAELLENLGLSELADRSPKETSLGEQQRAAFARALVLRPALLLADEPTGHQDRGFMRRVFETLERAAERGTTCLVATHDEGVLPYLDHAFAMSDGRLGAATAGGVGFEPTSELPR